MSKVKVSSLTGAALDWAVAKCEGINPIAIEKRPTSGTYTLYPHFYATLPLEYSTSWAQAGPIIEREGICLRTIRKKGHELHGIWLSAYDDGNTGTLVRWVKRTDWRKHYSAGFTPLVAAMRCYVSYKLGDEVEIPEQLMEN